MKRKRCGECKQKLAISNFGICRSRSDGRNYYCKPCIRKKVKAHRERKRAMRLAKIQIELARELGIPIVIPERKPIIMCGPRSPLEKVREALRNGFLTRAAIRNETRLDFDQIGDALAELTFVLREARIVRAGDDREFHLIAGFVQREIRIETKICKRCNEEKELTLFYRESRYADGRRPYCIECIRQRYRRSRAA